MINQDNPLNSDLERISILKSKISREKEIAKELGLVFEGLKKARDIHERNVILSQIEELQDSLKNLGYLVIQKTEEIKIAGEEQKKEKIERKQEINLLKPEKKDIKILKEEKIITPKGFTFSKLEKQTLKRIKKKERKAIVRKIKTPSKYINLSSKLFSKLSNSLINNKKFGDLNRDLTKANLEFTPTSYVSVIFFTTLLALVVAIILSIFLLFFNLSPQLPIITRSTEEIAKRFLKVFWIIFVAPLLTFLIMYIYPSIEKKYTENKINQELPFASIHMSAIAGSMIEPSKMFEIIISTKEYPYLEKEFTKIINEISIYGYNLVSVLRNISFNCASSKLSELYNGIATTITSGGDLSNFFQKRSESLLFDYRLEREKYTKFAETFMDIYISVVIAAPMILMLLLMIMKIGKFGLSLSVNAITLVMILGVGIINAIFMMFLHLKQPNE